MRRLLALLLLFAIAVALFVAAAGAAPSTTTNVTVGGGGQNRFSPSTVTVTVGDTVHWTNAGGNHDVAFDDGQFTSGTPSTGAWSADHTFTKAGTFTYLCTQHAAVMKGTVVVQAAPQPSPSPSPSPSPDPAPSASPDPSPAPSPGGGSAPQPVTGGGVAGDVQQQAARVRKLELRRGRGARVAGSLRVEPSGLQVRLVVTVRGRTAASKRYTASDGRVRFALRVDRRARRALARSRTLKVRLRVEAGGEVLERRTVKLRRRG